MRRHSRLTLLETEFTMNTFSSSSIRVSITYALTWSYSEIHFVPNTKSDLCLFLQLMKSGSSKSFMRLTQYENSFWAKRTWIESWRTFQRILRRCHLMANPVGRVAQQDTGRNARICVPFLRTLFILMRLMMLTCLRSTNVSTEWSWFLRYEIVMKQISFIVDPAKNIFKNLKLSWKES